MSRPKSFRLQRNLQRWKVSYRHQKAVIDEALQCKKTGEEKTILFALTGAGYFDLKAYGQFNDGQMSDYVPTDEELKEGLKICLQYNVCTR